MTIMQVTLKSDLIAQILDAHYLHFFGLKLC